MSSESSTWESLSLGLSAGAGWAAGTDPGPAGAGGYGPGQTWSDSCSERCPTAVWEPGNQKQPGVGGLVQIQGT